MIHLVSAEFWDLEVLLVFVEDVCTPTHLCFLNDREISPRLHGGMQALWEWTVLLPVTAAQAAQPRQEMGAWGWAGFAIYMLLFLFESGGTPFAPHLLCSPWHVCVTTYIRWRFGVWGASLHGTAWCLALAVHLFLPHVLLIRWPLRSRCLERYGAVRYLSLIHI